MLRRLILFLLLVGSSLALQAQSPADMAAEEGIWHGYDGEWRYVSRLLLALANAIPPEKYGWRPAPGVRSVSEVIMHIAQSNYYLLSVTGPKMPAELEGNGVEQTIVSKPEVRAYLRNSLEAVRKAHLQLRAADLHRKVKINGQTADVDGMYLRILCHDNEHLGQLIAYARVNNITPPWSAGEVLPR